MKTPILSLLFSIFFFAPVLSEATDGKCCRTNLLTVNDSVQSQEADIPIDVDAPFWFQEKVYIHIYDENDKPLISAGFTSKDLKENTELQALLRKSSRFLSLDSHHYYTYKE
jgi:hypothetical protein